jgi:nicotinamidase/pyrazinamidase
MVPLLLRQSSLLVVDVQQGFTTLCPRELPVPGGLEIVPNINRLLDLRWARIDASLDWHPPDHRSFEGRQDNLYPPHCVAGTPGAEFVPGLNTDRFHAIWRKGFRQDFEAYALTHEHEGFTSLLRAEGIRNVVVCGIAINICCFYVARDLRSDGFRVVMAEDASAGIDVPAAGLFQVKAKAEAQQLGIEYVRTAEILAAASADGKGAADEHD